MNEATYLANCAKNEKEFQEEVEALQTDLDYFLEHKDFKKEIKKIYNSIILNDKIIGDDYGIEFPLLDFFPEQFDYEIEYFEEVDYSVEISVREALQRNFVDDDLISKISEAISETYNI